MKPEFKPEFKDKMKLLLKNKEDFDNYEKISHIPPRNYIRANTLKMSVEELVERLKKKWSIKQPFASNPEIILIDQDLLPGELGSSIEHILGHYYVQEVCSMMSVIALNPEEKEFVLDVCASPGSKTTQIAAKMNNTGTLIANDVKLDRIIILNSNLERCGVSNILITRNDGIQLCQNLKNSEFKFDKILVDAPCSGEGTLRSSPKTFTMWNQKVVEKFSRTQKKIAATAIPCLKEGGILVYSTCTHSPEENEEVVSFLLNNFPLKLLDLNLPLKTRPGLTEWKNEKFHPDCKKTARIYPQDNDSEGFFVAKFQLLQEVKT
jgi:NOL1/NOP2/sun family putative RNA methylase